MAVAAAMNIYSSIFGFDLLLPAHCTQCGIISINDKEMVNKQSLLGKSELIAWPGSLNDCRSLTGVEDVFLFNGYSLLLFMTLYLCVISDVKSVRVALIHVNDLVDCGAVTHAESLGETNDHTIKISVKMTKGNTYPAFFMAMTEHRKKRIEETMESKNFLNIHKDFAVFKAALKKKEPREWTLEGKVKDSRLFAHPDEQDKTGSLEHQRYQVTKWLEEPKETRERELRKFYVTEHITHTTTSKKRGVSKENTKVIAKQHKQIVALKATNANLRKTNAAQSKEIAYLQAALDVKLNK